MQFKFSFLLFAIFCLCGITNAQSIVVPIAGNTWSNINSKNEKTITSKGIVNWSNPGEKFTTYVRFSKTGIIKIRLNAAASANTTIAISVKNKTKKININSGSIKEYDAGDWPIKDTGYTAITFSGIKKNDCCFANIESIRLAGTAINEQTTYVKNNEGNFFYWGRRGPSVHLNYPLPKDINAEWFYNEITVPGGNDVIGSYFMANGFGEGYFGIQVNAETERRILFSVWSPYNTDDPKEIPEDHKIIMLKKGEGVYTGEFGNEGSGGQSFLRYNWKAGITYKFLLHAVPEGATHTVYTAYFFDPQKNKWLLIAGFKRPQKATYLKGLHSFLENFIPEKGNIERKVYFTNQWVKDNTGNWHELSNAGFTADNTARTGYRKDYAGGVEAGRFYLKNCGFFDAYTPIGKQFERQKNNRPPEIDFSALP